MAPIDSKSDRSGANSDLNKSKPKIPEWRYGPARYWWDKLGLPEDSEDFDYGFGKVINRGGIQCFNRGRCHIGPVRFSDL